LGAEKNQVKISLDMSDSADDRLPMRRNFVCFRRKKGIINYDRLKFEMFALRVKKRNISTTRSKLTSQKT